MNLKTLFPQFRTATEDGGRPSDPASLIIPGKYGHVFYWGGDLLAVSVDGYTGIAARVRRLPFVAIVQDGDCGEVTATFAADRMDDIAQVVRLRRRMRLTDAERDRRRALGAAMASQNRRKNEALLSIEEPQPD